MITLLFTTHTWGLGSALIRWRHNSEWSHVEVLIPNTDQTIGAMFGRGVVMRPYKDAKDKASKYAVGVVRGLTPGQEARFYEFLHAQLGKPYDWRGALAIGLDQRHWDDPSRWFCSELVEAAFEAVGYPLVMKKASLVPPDPLATSVRVDLIWRTA